MHTRMESFGFCEFHHITIFNIFLSSFSWIDYTSLPVLRPMHLLGMVKLTVKNLELLTISFVIAVQL